MGQAWIGQTVATSGRKRGLFDRLAHCRSVYQSPKENSMRASIASGLLTLVLAGAPMVGGCDREVSKDETTQTHPDGSVSKDSTVVTEKPDGTVVKQQDHTVNP